MPLRRRNRRPPPTQRPEPAPVWHVNTSLPSPVLRCPELTEVGYTTVVYQPRHHMLSIKYYLEIYAPIDRVWLVMLDSIYDTW